MLLVTFWRNRTGSSDGDDGLRRAILWDNRTRKKKWAGECKSCGPFKMAVVEAWRWLIRIWLYSMVSVRCIVIKRGDNCAMISRGCREGISREDLSAETLMVREYEDVMKRSALFWIASKWIARYACDVFQMEDAISNLGLAFVSSASFVLGRLYLSFA